MKNSTSIFVVSQKQGEQESKGNAGKMNICCAFGCVDDSTISESHLEKSSFSVLDSTIESLESFRYKLESSIWSANPEKYYGSRWKGHLPLAPMPSSDAQLSSLNKFEE